MILTSLAELAAPSPAPTEIKLVGWEILGAAGVMVALGWAAAMYIWLPFLAYWYRKTGEAQGLLDEAARYVGYAAIVAVVGVVLWFAVT